MGGHGVIGSRCFLCIEKLCVACVTLTRIVTPNLPPCYLDHRSNRIVADLMCSTVMVIQMIVAPIHCRRSLLVLRTLQRRWRRKTVTNVSKGSPFGCWSCREFCGHRAYRTGCLRWRCGHSTRSGSCHSDKGRLFLL